MRARYTKLSEAERQFLTKKRENKHTKKTEYIRCTAILMSENHTMQEIAKFFNVSVRTVINWLNLWEERKQTTKNTRKGRPFLIETDEEKIFIEELCHKNSAKMIAKLFNEAFEKSICSQTVNRFLKKNTATKGYKSALKRSSQI